MGQIKNIKSDKRSNRYTQKKKNQLNMAKSLFEPDIWFFTSTISKV